MFAVIKTGGKQYKVAANDTIKIEKLDAAEGDIVTFDQVLMVGEAGDVTIGAPLVAGASVAAEFLGTAKQKTVIILKKHRRLHYDRRNGHRQLLSSVRITEILTGGAKPTIKAKAKAKPAATAPAAEEAVTEKPARKAATKKAASEAETEVKAEAAAPAPEAAAPVVEEKKAPAKKAAAPKKAAAKPKAEAAAETKDTAPKKAPAKRAAKPKAEKE
jgi:large subunit ribosomal protein L21